MAKAKNLFDSAKENLDSIAQLLESDYPDKKRLHKAIKILKRPQNILKKKLILKLTNGKKRVFQSFRVQHSDARGQFMGGVRYEANLSEENVKGLSILESIKSALVDLPFGGAFGGIDVNQSKISPKDLERLTKMYSQFLTNYIGAWKDILFTESGTSNKTMNWAMEAFEKKKRSHSPATFNGNPHELDGAVYILSEYLKITNIFSRFKKIDVVIHGFGNRAYIFAKNLNNQNFRVVAVSDKSGGVVDSKGFDIEELKKLKNKFSTLKEVSAMKKIEFIDNEKLLQLPVDILVISSREGIITKEVAEKINSKLILELVNFGITKEVGDTILNKNIEIIPDIMVNSSFSTLSHLEWVQKMHGYKWTREEVSRRLIVTTTKLFRGVKEISNSKSINIRQSSYYMGVKRLIDSIMERGRV